MAMDDNIPDAWPEPLDSRALSWLSEEARGRANQDLTLVRRESDSLIQLKDAVNGDEPLCRVRTDDTITNRARVSEVTVKVGTTGKVQPIDKVADALFWTEASIEKFFIPYYVAHRLLLEDDWQNFYNLYKSEEVAGFAHLVPSHYREIKGEPDTCAVLLKNTRLEGGLEIITVAEALARLRRQDNLTSQASAPAARDPVPA